MTYDRGSLIIMLIKLRQKEIRLKFGKRLRIKPLSFTIAYYGQMKKHQRILI